MTVAIVQSISRIEKIIALQAMKKHKNNKKRAAKALDITVHTLKKWLKIE